MQSIDFCYSTAIICAVYLITLLSKRAYRLLLPSIIHSTTWLITSCLIIVELKGNVFSERILNNDINLSSEFILYLVIASIVGFSAAHILGKIRVQRRKVIALESEKVEVILKRFRWIPYACFIIGSLIFVHLFKTIGILNTFSEFREHAVTMEWSGPMAIVKQISGHIYIFASFYLMLLGYKHGQKGVNIKEFLKYGLLCSTINIAIGGRLWMITSLLPYLTALIFSRAFSKRDKKSLKSDIKRISAILITLTCTFSIVGLARDSVQHEKKFMDKFLYFTDGTKMTNLVLQQYPPGTYQLEYGASEFLSQFKISPMDKKFKNSISDNAGLSVTVRSSMPPLYYDFGYTGGIIMWGIFCFIIELLTIRLMTTRKIIGVLLFIQLSIMLFLSPIFEIFSVYAPTFEWLLIISLLSSKLFKDKSKRHL